MLKEIWRSEFILQSINIFMFNDSQLLTYFFCSSMLCEKIRYPILFAICLSNKVYLPSEMKNAYSFTYSSKWVFVARCAIQYIDKLTFIERVWFFTFLSSIFGPSLLMLWAGIATGYGLDCPGIEFRWGRDFPNLSRTALVPTQPPVQRVPALSRG